MVRVLLDLAAQAGRSSEEVDVIASTHVREIDRKILICNLYGMS